MHRRHFEPRPVADIPAKWNHDWLAMGVSIGVTGNCEVLGQARLAPGVRNASKCSPLLPLPFRFCLPQPAENNPFLCTLLSLPETTLPAFTPSRAIVCFLDQVILYHSFATTAQLCTNLYNLDRACADPDNGNSTVNNKQTDNKVTFRPAATQVQATTQQARCASKQHRWCWPPLPSGIPMQPQWATSMRMLTPRSMLSHRKHDQQPQA